MLTHLSIRDVVLIDRLDLEFEKGLCVLTGETGAGKSIVLDALGLALGARADLGLIRAKSDKLSVSASFLLPSRHRALALLAEHDIATEDGAVVIRRVLSRDGRGKAFANDQPISVGLLRDLGELLVEVHGQFDTHGLLDPATHLGVLDDFRIATAGDALDRVCADAFKTWRTAAEALKEAEAQMAQAVRDEAHIRAAVDELKALDPRPGEEKSLADRRALLRSAEHIVAALADARANLAGENDVEEKLRTVHVRLSRLAPQAAGLLDGLCQTLDRAAIETAEAIREIERVAGNVEAEPKELEKAEERLFALKTVARKHRCTVDELPGILTGLSAQLDSIDHGAERVKSLAAAAAGARQAFETAARKLHDARVAAAAKLDKAVAKELAPLKLDKATVRAAVTAVPEEQWSERGASRVVFEASTNPGAPIGPLAKIASGGELARFMLALKVVLAGTQPLATLIFDEVDTGIGGATANAVGLRLERLAKDVQVLVVTHSPQVAARAHHHWRVSKATKAGEALTKVAALSDAERREEVARMLAGAAVTDEARAAAQRLIAGTAS
ncbi:MAG: DNA repair protein RecN [Rhodospirillaceae bacterium]|nr:DNA repair protein RecN [Rhodospirillaceae bacterium]